MATEQDLLLRTLSEKTYVNRADRLYYSTGEMLGADDFQAEQIYHRRQLAMALRFLYGSGTLAGLKVCAVPGDLDSADPEKLSEVQILVKQGLAIDRAGRLVEVPVPVSIRLKRWLLYITDPEQTGDPHAADRIAASYDNTTAAVIAEIFLKFYASKRGWTPAFASGPFDALDASQPSRIRDAYELQLMLCTGNKIPTYDPWDSVPENATDAQVQEAILSAWDTLKLPENGDFHEVPSALNDSTAIRLARLQIPVIGAGTPKTVEDLDWRRISWSVAANSDGDNTKNIDNSVRNFIVPPALLRRLHNL